MTGRGVPAGERGTSLVEILVAMVVALVVFGGAFAIVMGDSKVYRSQANISEMRANARNALEFLTRDVRPAGYGLANLPASIPVIIANLPDQLTTASTTAITMRYNGLDVSTTLSDPMPQPSSELKVTSTAGFAEGMRVMIWDQTGSYDWLVITQVQTSSSHLQHNTTDASKRYRPEDGTVIGAIDEISYRYVAATKQIERQQNAGTWYAVANNVELLELRYWDASDTEIFPADDASRRSIRKVGVEIRVRTAERDRLSNNWRTYTVRSEITPRNLPFLPES